MMFSLGLRLSFAKLVVIILVMGFLTLRISSGEKVASGMDSDVSVISPYIHFVEDIKKNRRDRTKDELDGRITSTKESFSDLYNVNKNTVIASTHDVTDYDVNVMKSAKNVTRNAEDVLTDNNQVDSAKITHEYRNENRSKTSDATLEQLIRFVNTNDRNDISVFRRPKRSFDINAVPQTTTKPPRSCCKVFPKLCHVNGSCMLDIGLCVQLCVCATGTSDQWCSEVFNILTSSSRTVQPPTSSTSTSVTTPRSFVTDREITSEDLFYDRNLGEHNDSSIIYSPGNEIIPDNNISATFNLSDNTASPSLSSFLPDLSNLIRNSPKCENCSGACIFGDDWEPRCVKAERVRSKKAACPPGFHCRHGHCIITDGKVACHCQRNWTGAFCDVRCELDCGQHGHCVIHDKAVCVCDWNYTGLHCDRFRPKEKYIPESSIKPHKAHWETIVVCVALIIILVLVFVFLPYFLYRRKWLPIRKLVHYFQQYEDDDGKEYDAFVSYKSCKNDEEFVLEKLYPVLEKDMGFKLCLHFRDFLPGEIIANSIIQAIENSRRTIMILTPNYIKSEWCRLEYQKAQHEMLKLKHKIIPIILEDVSKISEMDKNLKAILDTVTYIEWPADENSKKREKFWKMLSLTMPKKKDTADISSGKRSPSEMPLTSVPSLTLSDSLSDDVFTPPSFTRSVSIPIDADVSKEWTESNSVNALNRTNSVKSDKNEKIDQPVIKTTTGITLIENYECYTNPIEV